MTIGGTPNPPAGELYQAGVRGMHWGIRKPDTVGGGSQIISYRQQIQGHAVLVTGQRATRTALQKYGHLTIPAVKAVGKTVAKGSGMTVKILALVGKGTFKLSKSYLKTAVAIGKLGRR